MSIFIYNKINMPQNNNENKKKFSILNFSPFPKLSIRTIAFIGILTAISVVIFIICASFIPLISLPTYKISFIGLPIKISGFVFGPIVGGLVGLISDLISFALFPTFYNIYYTIAAIVDGVAAGIVGLIFLKLFKYVFGGPRKDAVIDNKIFRLKKQIEELKLTATDFKQIEKLENKIIKLAEEKKLNTPEKAQSRLLNANMISAIILIAIICFAILVIVQYLSDETISKSVIKNRIGLIMLMETGYILIFFFLIIARYKMKPKRYMTIVPIVMFSALIEFINVPLLSLADFKSTTGTTAQAGSILAYMFPHIMFTPVKIWFNMAIIFYTFSVIAPLLRKNDDIVY